jgi:hypothetical protein
MLCSRGFISTVLLFNTHTFGSPCFPVLFISQTISNYFLVTIQVHSSSSYDLALKFPFVGQNKLGVR